MGFGRFRRRPNDVSGAQPEELKSGDFDHDVGRGDARRLSRDKHESFGSPARHPSPEQPKPAGKPSWFGELRRRRSQEEEAEHKLPEEGHDYVEPAAAASAVETRTSVGRGGRRKSPRKAAGLPIRDYISGRPAPSSTRSRSPTTSGRRRVHPSPHGAAMDWTVSAGSSVASADASSHHQHHLIPSYASSVSDEPRASAGGRSNSGASDLSFAPSLVGAAMELYGQTSSLDERASLEATYDALKPAAAAEARAEGSRRIHTVHYRRAAEKALWRAASLNDAEAFDAAVGRAELLGVGPQGVASARVCLAATAMEAAMEGRNVAALRSAIAAATEAGVNNTDVAAARKRLAELKRSWW